MSGNQKSRTRWSYVAWAVAIIFLCVVSAAIGGLLTRNFEPHTFKISYPDFISVMLTAVSLLMTVLAIFLAIIGFVGWTSIEQKVLSKTEEVLSRGLEKGQPLERLVSDRVNAIMFEGIDPLAGAASEDSGTNSARQGPE